MGFFDSVFKVAVTAAVVAATVAFIAPASTAVAGAAIFGLTGASAYIATAALTAAAISTISYLTADTPEAADIGEQLRGQLVSKREPAGNAYIVYGKTRIGGTIVHMEATGSKNETMYMAMAMAGHEITGIDNVYVNDDKFPLTTSGNIYTINYQGSTSVINFDYLLGTNTQSAMELFSGTTASGFQFKGIATLGAKLVYDADKFPLGLPNITAEIRGKKVYDPRTDTTAYSTNAALCIRDYLTDIDYGMAATDDEIDDDSFSDAADICDQSITLADSSTEARYTINGAFSSGEQPKDILSKMLTSCGGMLSYVGGKWTLKVAEYRTPTVTLTEDDVVGQISVQGSQSRRDIFNAIKGTYSEPETLYQVASFPPVTNSLYEAEDNEKIWKDTQFPFTTSSAACQRLAKIDLEKSRQQIVVNLSCNLNAFSLQPGDNVYLSFDRYGWNQKVFEVIDWSFSFVDSDGGATPVVNLTLRETASGVYAWANGSETVVDLAPNTNLPDPFLVTAPGVTSTDILYIAAETVITKLVVTLSGESTFQYNYEVQAKLSSDTDWINLGQATGTIFELNNAVDGATYNIRARSINSFGVRSDWTLDDHEVVGKTAPPQDVTGFSINVVGANAYLTWEPVPDLDLSHYRIRHARETTGANYANSIDLVTKVPRPGVFASVPAMTGTYFIKAIDKIGNESLNPAEIVAIIDGIQGLNVVETITESPTFAGSKTEVNITEDGYLILDTSIDFDSATGNFDDYPGDFDGGGGTISTEGTYYFSNTVDLGSVYTSRVTANITVDRLDYVNLFDDAEGDFDTRTGLFDGDPNTYGDTNVIFYISTTEDNPAGSPIWTDYRQFYVGDYKARAFRFKIVLTSQNGDSSPRVKTLSVTVDMPDRVTSGDNLASGAGAYPVTFSPAFKTAPAIGIAAQNLQQGDYYEISSKSASGFTITFRNSSGTAVNRTFDYVARGYGELVT
jgi:hypothetical protein